MLCGLHGGDVARKPLQLLAHFLAGFAMQPPEFGVTGTVFGLPLCVSLGFDALGQPLVHRRKAAAHRVGVQAKQVNHHHTTRGAGQVAAIAIGADVLFKARLCSQAQRLGFLRCDDETRTKELYSTVTEAQVRPYGLCRSHIRPNAQVRMDQPLALRHFHLHFTVVAGLFLRYGKQLAFALGGAGHGHGDAHRRAVGAVHPGVVGHGKAQAQALGQAQLHHAPVKGLAQAVGGDQAKALRLARAHQRGGAMPPVHDKVRALGHRGPDAAQRVHIAFAQGAAHGTGANKGRVAHNKVCRWPLGLAGVDVAPLRHLRRIIRHLLAGGGVGFGGDAVPAQHRAAGGVGQRLQAVVGEHGVAVFDVAVVVHHGFGHAAVAKGADVPLQKANPQHQLGQGGGAFVEFDAAQLLQGDGLIAQVQRLLGVAQGA